MKRLVMVVCLWSAFLADLGAEDVIPDPLMLAAHESNLEEPLAAFSKAVENVEDTMARVVDAGLMQPDTQPIVLEILRRCHPIGPYRLPPLGEMAQIGGDQPEWQPFVSAWRNLRFAADRVILAMHKSHGKAVRELKAAIVEAASQTETPGELAALKQKQAAYYRIAQRKEPPTLPPSRGIIFLTTPSSSWSKEVDMVDLMMSMLEETLPVFEALQRKDHASVGSRVEWLDAQIKKIQGPGYTVPPPTAGLLPSFHLLKGILTRRLSEAGWNNLRISLVAVEQAILAHRSASECELLIQSLESDVKALEKVLVLSHREFSHPYSSGALPAAYRQVVRYLTVATPTKDAALPEVVFDKPLTMGPEFQVFLKQLKKDQEKAKATGLKTGGRDDLLETMQAEESLLARLNTIQTPQDLIALAEQLPAATGLSKEELKRNQEWNSLEEALRRLASWWQDPVAKMPGSAQLRGGATSIVFVATRDRIARRIVAEKFRGSEIETVPYSEMPAFRAVQRLAGEIGQRGDWDRALRILEAANPPLLGHQEKKRMERQIAGIRRYLDGLAAERVGAIRAAAFAYHQILTEPSEGIPVQEAADRVRILRQQNSQAFENFLP